MDRMLIGFKFRNFRSFLSEQNFGFSTSSDRMHETTHLMHTGMKSVPRLSKAAIVFGPNASGKSNLLAAFSTFRDMVVHSTHYSDSQYAERHTPFRFGPSTAQPTEFEIDVLLDQVRYRYSLSYDAERIRSERLLVYRTGKSQRWFDRRFDPETRNEEWAPFSPSFNGPREMWRKATRPRALFLTAATQLNSQQLAPLTHWIERCLEIVFPADMTDLDRVATRIQDAGYKARILELLHAVDLPVDDLRVTEREPAQKCLEFMYASKGLPPIWLGSLFEAAGTQRLLGLLGPLLEAIEHGKLLLIDEFDTSLHPLVARFLIQLFNDPALSNRGAQLLLTSHNISLMDLSFLRRDEIWLAQLNPDHTSLLAPLLRSSPRKHELVAKNYLRGRYGAVPVIRSVAN